MNRIDDILNNHQGAEAYEEVLDSLWDISEDGTNLDALNDAQRPLIVSQMVQDEINGGGINALFYNNGRKLPRAGASAFETIGAIKAMEILQRAIVIFPEQPIPDDVEKCRQILEKLPQPNMIDEQWHDLTDAFYELDDYMLKVSLEYIRVNSTQLAN